MGFVWLAGHARRNKNGRPGASVMVSLNRVRADTAQADTAQAGIGRR